VIFHSYVNLPEGSFHASTGPSQRINHEVDPSGQIGLLVVALQGENKVKKGHGLTNCRLMKTISNSCFFVEDAPGKNACQLPGMEFEKYEPVPENVAETIQAKK
jgi:hypothetical protein